MKKTLILLAALPGLLAACASEPTAPTATSSLRQEREFTTGSNLPRRNRMGGDGVSVMTPEEFERARTGGGQGAQGLPPGSAQ